MQLLENLVSWNLHISCFSLKFNVFNVTWVTRPCFITGRKIFLENPGATTINKTLIYSNCDSTGDVLRGGHGLLGKTNNQTLAVQF